MEAWEENEEKKDLSAEISDDGKSVDAAKKAAEKKDDRESKYEDVCFICRRPESKAGKMYHLPKESR